MSRLFLVEDDASLGATLQERLQKQGHGVRWVQSIAQAETHFAAGEFDLVILDVGLPDGSGFDFAEKIRGRSSIPFIFVTAMSTAEYRLQGFEMGAEEYIPKPFHLKEFLLRVQHVLENHSVQRVFKLGSAEIDFASHSVVQQSGREVRLTTRDAQILKLLTERSPEVVSRDEILSRFWGDDKFPSERTVDNCIVRLRQAIADDSGEVIRSVRGVGYQIEKRQHGQPEI